MPITPFHQYAPNTTEDPERYMTNLGFDVICEYRNKQAVELQLATYQNCVYWEFVERGRRQVMVFFGKELNN